MLILGFKNEGLPLHADLLDGAHVEQTGAEASGEAQETQDTELLLGVVEDQEEDEGGRENEDVGRRGEAISIVRQRVSLTVRLGQRVDGGHVSNLDGSPADVEQTRQSHVPSLLERYIDDFSFVIFLVDETWVSEDAGKSWQNKYGAEDVPRHALTARRTKRVTEDANDGRHDAVGYLTREHAQASQVLVEADDVPNVVR